MQQASKCSTPAGSVRAPVAQASPEPGDTELVRDAAGGDSDAFHALIDRHAGHLFRLAVSLCGSAADADDVLQETFAGAFRSLRRFEGRSSVKTWLSRILVTQAALWRRGKGARRAMSLSDGTPGQEPAVARPGSGPDRVAWRMDLQAALDKLSHDHREVIVLRELQGLSYDEIAQAPEHPPRHGRIPAVPGAGGVTRAPAVVSAVMTWRKGFWRGDGMECPYTGQIGAYLDGELPSDERRALEAHLSSCEPCPRDGRGAVAQGAVRRRGIPGVAGRGAVERLHDGAEWLFERGTLRIARVLSGIAACLLIAGFALAQPIEAAAGCTCGSPAAVGVLYTVGPVDPGGTDRTASRQRQCFRWPPTPTSAGIDPA